MSPDDATDEPEADSTSSQPEPEAATAGDPEVYDPIAEALVHLRRIVTATDDDERQAVLSALRRDRDALLGLVVDGAGMEEVADLLAQLTPRSVVTDLLKLARRVGGEDQRQRDEDARQREKQERVKAEEAPKPKPGSMWVGGLPILVVHGPTHWVLVEGRQYIAVKPELLAAEIERNHKIDTWHIPAKGEPRRMTSQEVYDAVDGVTAKRVRWVYGGRSAWDPVTRTLDLPGAQVREGRAARSERCETWLRKLVLPEQHDKLLDCLAVAPMLDRPTAAMDFRGETSAGKAMLVAALSTLLGGQCAYEHATGKWNAVMIHGPLIVLDEGVSESRPDAFRRTTGNREHDVEPKFRMMETLIGCPRHISTSNEQDPRRLGREQLSSQSEAALGRRIVGFDVQKAATDYLAENGGWEMTDGWCEPDGELVCHLRWLWKTRKVTYGARFLVEGNAAEWIATAHLREGLGALVVTAWEAYQDAVEEGRTSEFSKRQPFYQSPDNAQHVGVNVSGLLHWWEELTGEKKTPSHTALARELKRLSGSENPQRLGGEKDRGPRYYLVPVETLTRE
jgi:hypothetical protein